MLVVDGCDEIGSRTSDLVSTTRGVHALKGLALLESGSGGGLDVSCQYIGLWFCVHLHRLTFSLRSMEDSQDGNGRSVLTGADASCAGTARSPTAAGRGIV